MNSISKNIASIRQEYLLASLHEADTDSNPIVQFNKWFQEAVHAEIEDVTRIPFYKLHQYHLSQV